MQNTKKTKICFIVLLVIIIFTIRVVIHYNNLRVRDYQQTISNIKIEVLKAKAKKAIEEEKRLLALKTDKEETVEEQPVVEETTPVQNTSTVAQPVIATSVSCDLSHRDLRNFEPVTVDQLNNYIDNMTRYNTSSPFRGQGEVFIKASEESGLDPRYILAHAALESGWGTSYLARTKHNYFGIAAYDNSPGSAYSMGNEMESGIINGAKWIADNYTNQGQSTLHSMIYGAKRYASDSGWINKIKSIMVNI